MKSILDAGHKYELITLDGSLIQNLIFVKRCDLNNPNKFPGNTNAYPGTTLQSVIRCLIDRVKYLQNQVFSIENIIIINLLKINLWLFEFRAARRHGKFYIKTPNFAAYNKMCEKCGHTVCNCKI